MRVDRVAILDWSTAGKPRVGKDSIWLGVADASGVIAENLPTRAQAEARLCALIDEAQADNEKLLIGVDFNLGFPAGFAKRLTGDARAAPVWEWLAARVTDGSDNAHNLPHVAAEANAAFAGQGPFWGNGRKEDVAGLPRTRPELPEGLSAARRTEIAATGPGSRPKSTWQLSGAGAVGAQGLMGMAMLHRLRLRYPEHLFVWPFEEANAPVTVAEVYPSMLSAECKALCASNPDMVTDEAQVRVLASALLNLSDTAELMDLREDAKLLVEEGWILGAGHQLALRRAVPAMQEPPRLRDDCFAMPQGVDWVPVDEALERLRIALKPITTQETCRIGDAAGGVLAADCFARRSNPPRPNSAVDGYGFAHAATSEGPQRLPLVDGRAAAGQPYDGTVPQGAAVRILTGAILPDGVDTVVLEEDTASDGAAVVFDGPVKPFSNTRKAGEDVMEDALALPAGHRLRAPDIALLSALGVAEVQTFRPLRVGVLSTGDEIIAAPHLPALPHQIWDANRPMLLTLARNWGYEAVDLGHATDDPEKIAARLSDGAKRADVILTSGGASAGDEDHVSALLRARGTLSSWRIALKPGRPLALALWEGTPVFGLPGNPVAALICALIFARPAFSLMAGAGWLNPQGFTVPAAFSKSKKPGRREYLRARLNADGAAEVFASEGSGRISGLSWADGLVELPDGAVQITPGTPVRYLPYSSLGLT
ncbi:molybdopterin molybdotransferase [Primorskyibacter sedentarius]|uniref:Molybdopterin molybdenumtransferase n=1 Tax=Primorskyibacter sedentarius TaxID=745311 RepID=A0A4R3JGI0_9RHOB|nr:gephyrin-like molybdotransferase Glp [Primorskyibacter sedentarius]TCS65259.1 molybdopterin molybdotransferase [Primorskyibacter sedentarius]